jgi:flavin-dependent dehydrogenase
MNKQGDSADVYDVIIVGGGPAGASAAIRLGATGARVLLVEQKKFPRAKLCGEFISPECAAHFAALGVLEQMTEAGATRVVATDFYTRGGHKVSVPSAWFGADGGGHAHAASALGLSRAEMDQRLLMRARAVGVEVLEETTASGLVRADARVCGVELQCGDTQRVVRAPITIDATGRARVLVRRVARARDEHSNGNGQPHKARARLVAFKAHLDNVKLAEGACEIYFYRGGYGGLSRVEGGLSNLCFIVAARDVRARGSDADRVMREVLMTNRRAAETLRGARVCSEWLAVALESFGRAQLVPAAGLLTIGDAAAFIDPFTGSGMLMALESGALAAQVIAPALPALRAGHDFAALAADYRARYRARFNARLRVCSVLRRAAFAPSIVTAAAALALNTSASLRRALARATRQSA